jgi:hypothetical protein
MIIKFNENIKDLLKVKTNEDLLALENETGIPADRLGDLLFEGRKPSVSELIAIHTELEERGINISPDEMLCIIRPGVKSCQQL